MDLALDLDLPALPPPPCEMERSAHIEGCYRYSLFRRWDLELPTLGVIMLNPSTADAETDDPTIRRLYGFARHEGFGAIRVCNLYAFRTAEPVMLKMKDDPVGPRNGEYIKDLITHHQTILCAWGAELGVSKGIKAVKSLYECLRANGYHPSMVCLGKTRHGRPRHPLYVPGNQPFEPYELP